MERATKIIVFASLLAALTTEVWLLRPAWPNSALLTLGAFFGSLAAFLSFGDVVVVIILPLAYVLPIGFRFLAGHWDATLWLPWLAALAGVVVPRALDSRWRFPNPWKAPLLLWALVVAMSWPIVAARELDFSLATLYERHLATSIRGGTPAAAALWTAHVASTTLVGLLFLEWLITEYSDTSDRFERRIVMPLFLGSVFCSTVAVYQVFGDVTFLNPTVFAVLGRSAGTMLDGNALGILAAVWLPFSAVMAFDRTLHRWPQAVAWSAAAGVLAVGLWASGSRSALLAAALGLVVTAGHRMSMRSRPRDGFLLGAVLVVLGAAAFVLAPASVGGPVNRIRETIGPRFQVGTLIETLWTRDGYGAAAVRMIEDDPLTGVGIGAFNTYVRDVGSRLGWDSLEPDNAQNWWRHQLAELGLLGSLGAFAWTFFLIAEVIALRRHDDAPLATGAIKGAIFGFASASLVGMPGQVPVVAVTFIAFVFWLVTANHATAQATTTIRTWGWAGMTTTVGVFLAATTVVALTDMRPPYRALRAGWPYHYGFFNFEGTSDAQFRWTMQKAVNVVPVGGPWLELVVGGSVPPDAGQDPLEVKLWRDRSLILRVLRRDGSPIRRYVRMHDGASWVMLQIETDRTWRPSDYGATDTRELGVTVAPWTWVNRPPAGAITIE